MNLGPGDWTGFGKFRRRYEARARRAGVVVDERLSERLGALYIAHDWVEHRAWRYLGHGEKLKAGQCFRCERWCLRPSAGGGCELHPAMVNGREPPEDPDGDIPF